MQLHEPAGPCVYGNAGHPHQATLIGTRGLTYDLNGNTASECKGACSFTNQPVRTFQWTEENWLAAVVDGNGKGSPRSSTATTFLYDGAGQRVVKENPDSGNSITIGQFFALTGGHAGTKHVFAGDTRVATKLISTTMKSGGPAGGTPGNGTGGAGNQGNGNGGGPQNDNGCVPSNYNPKKCPTVPGAAPTLGGGPGGGGPPTFVAGTFYYHPDHLGSTSWMTDQAGKVREHVEYYPYGEIWRDVRNDLDGNKPTTQEFLFTGKELDPEMGLYYFGARYYDPRFARWVSPDVLLREGHVRPSPGNLSPYAYAYLSPVGYRDPNGQCAVNANGTVNCAAPAEKVQADLVRNFRDNAKSGEYGLAAIDVVLELANSPNVFVGEVTQGLFGSSYNAGYDFSAGFQTGDFNRALKGAANLLGLAVMGKLGEFATVTPAVAPEGAAVAKGGLGDLTPAETKQIQSVVDRAGRPLEVVGSAAKSARRGVGTDLPIGKGPGTQSDIDYLVPPGSTPYYRGLEGQLPGLDPKSGIIPGTHNPYMGPAIRFEPGAQPRVVPEASP